MELFTAVLLTSLIASLTLMVASLADDLLRSRAVRQTPLESMPDNEAAPADESPLPLQPELPYDEAA